MESPDDGGSGEVLVRPSDEVEHRGVVVALGGASEGSSCVRCPSRDSPPDGRWEATGGVDVKGKGRMETFLWTPPAVYDSLSSGTAEIFPTSSSSAAVAQNQLPYATASATESGFRRASMEVSKRLLQLKLQPGRSDFRRGGPARHQ